MATKAELQYEYERCEQIRRGVRASENARDFVRAVKQAETALPHQHAAIAFQRRFMKSATPAIPVVDAILRYAPVFFLGSSIDVVEAWYSGGTKTERNALPALPTRIINARQVLEHAVELWEVMAESPSAKLSPRLTPQNTTIVPLWVDAGVVAHHPNDANAYVRVTDLRRKAVAKCEGCGRERAAPLAELLEPTSCPACERRCAFVLTRRVF